MAGGEQVAPSFDSASFLALTDRLMRATDDRALSVDGTNQLLQDTDAGLGLLNHAWEVDEYVPLMLGLVSQLVHAQHHTASRDFYLSRGKLASALFAGAATAANRTPDVFLGPTLAVALELQEAAVHEPTFAGGLTEYYLGTLDHLVDTPHLTDEQARDAMQHLFNTATAEQLGPLYKAIADPDSRLSQSRRFNRRLFSQSLLGISMLGEGAGAGRLEKLVAIVNELSGGRAEQLLRVWNMSTLEPSDNRHAMREVYVTNFAAMCALERETTLKDGQGLICSFLLDYYNIHCFGKYPTDQLRKQYEEHGMNDKPHGLLITAVTDTDHEEYTFDRGNHALIAQGIERVDRRLRVYEAATVADFVLALQISGQTHGGANFMLVYGHGDDKGNVILSTPGDGTVGLSASVLKLFDLSSLRSAFADDAFVLCLLCSAGVPGGPGQELSNQLRDMPVSGADSLFLDDLSFLGFYVTPDNKLHAAFNPQLAYVVGERPVPVTVRTYRNGVQVG